MKTQQMTAVEEDISSEDTSSVTLEEDTTKQDSETAPKSIESSKEPEKVDLAAKYAAIEDIGERAFAILKDLGTFNK